jgi:exodeoxyribonuclease X
MGGGVLVPYDTRIRIVDIESSVLDPNLDSVVEIAAYDLCLPDLHISRVGAYIVNPGRAIPPAASAIHHLTDADVADGLSFQDAWSHIAAIAEPAATIYAAHNCDFEKSFLAIPSDAQWLCTHKSALRAWPDAPAHNNQTLRYWRGLDLRQQQGFDRELAKAAHRAEPDAYVTAWLLGDLLSEVPLQTLLDWSSQPKIFPTLGFGKHRGEKWENVPTDYLSWLRDGQHTLDGDWRYGANVELERRSQQNDVVTQHAP